MTEEWRDIPEFPDYRVSSHGRVRSLFTGEIRKHQMSRLGYCRIGLYRDRRPVCRFIHRLVAAAFIGPCPDGLQTNHIDGDKTNNHIENLEYLTRHGNIRHSWKIGLRSPILGTSHGMSKLTEAQVLGIRSRYAWGAATQTALAQEYGVSQSRISYIVTRRNWKHI